MDRYERLFDATEALHRLVDEQRQQVTVERRHLLAAGQTERIIAARVQLAGLVGRPHRVMFGDRDHIEAAAVSHVPQQLRHRRHAVTVTRMDVEVGAAQRGLLPRRQLRDA